MPIPRRRFIALSLLTLAGCSNVRSLRNAPPAFVNGIPEQAIENPLFVPPIDREFLWQQLVDVVDNYFKIEREDRVRSINGVLTEGRIDTRPTIGSTWLEPSRSVMARVMAVRAVTEAVERARRSDG